MALPLPVEILAGIAIAIIGAVIIGFALGRPGAASLAQRLAQFADSGLDVAEVAQDDARGLVSN